MFKLQHQFSNFIETTQLTNDQMSLWLFEVSTTSSKLQHQPPVALFEKSFTALSIGPCGRLPQITWGASLRFGDCFWLCLKLAVSLQHCTPHAIVHWVYIGRIWRPLVICDEIWTVGLRPVPCAAHRVCWRTVLLEDESGKQLANNNLVVVFKRNKLMFIKTSLWCHRLYRGNWFLKIK